MILWIFVILGEGLVDSQLTEFAKVKFPNLQGGYLDTFKSLHMGDQSLAELALNLGVQHVVLCKETEHLEGDEAIAQQQNSTGIPASIMAQSIFGIVGAIHESKVPFSLHYSSV